MQWTRGFLASPLRGGYLLSIGWGLLAHLVLAPSPLHADYRPLPSVRQPTALVLTQEGAILLVANQKSGTITEIDTKSVAVVAEHPIGGRLTDLAVIGTTLCAVDNANSQLLLLSQSPTGITLLRSIPLPQDPLQIAVSATDGMLAVSCRWSRSVVLGKINEVLAVHDAAEDPFVNVQLPFSPRCVLPCSRLKKLFVADAFGSGFAVIDLPSRSLEAVHEIAGHNLAGLACDQKEGQLFVSHQHLNRLARTRHDDVFWGTVVSNVLEVYSTAQLVQQAEKRLYPTSTLFLGDPNHGSGDPAAIAITPSGKRIVALAGIGELAFQEGKQPLRFVPVGARPAAILLHPDEKILYVANQHSDTISVVDTEREEVVTTISLGPEVALSALEKGERAFFDARLSLSGWYSCHSCHTDGHTCGGAADTAGDGSFGAPKQIPSLLGVGHTAPWGWLGSIGDLHSQAHRSIVSTMQGTEPPPEVVDALAFYLQSLEPVTSTHADWSSANQIEAGRSLFEGLGCAGCHSPPTYTSPATYDVGLVDEVANSRFNPPSLRGVRNRAPYLHDGRAATLQAVFRDHGHQLPVTLTDAELDQLLAFLSTL